MNDTGDTSGTLLAPLLGVRLGRLLPRDLDWTGSNITIYHFLL